MAVRVEFCGELYDVNESRPFSIGREGDLVVDDNRFLHRAFLTIRREGAVMLLCNVGGRLAATVADTDTAMEAFLGPGAAIPITFMRTRVSFTAGSTTYELFVVSDEPLFRSSMPTASVGGETTLGAAQLTPDQRLLIVALSEPVLSMTGRVGAVLPSSAQGAARLGWTTTKFNRKLDNVCQKLSKLGVQGLHGRPGELASGRRGRLVEYATSTRLVTPADLDLLPANEGAGA